jgi:hypothetical protein
VNNSVPVRTEETRLESRGCARIGTEDLLFYLSWTETDVEGFLRHCLPRAFEYIDTQSSFQKSGQPSWVLLNKQKGRLTRVPAATAINGHALKRFRGREGAPIAETGIYIGETPPSKPLSEPHLTLQMNQVCDMQFQAPS